MNRAKEAVEQGQSNNLQMQVCIRHISVNAWVFAEVRAYTDLFYTFTSPRHNHIYRAHSPAQTLWNVARHWKQPFRNTSHWSLASCNCSLKLAKPRRYRSKLIPQRSFFNWNKVHRLFLLYFVTRKCIEVLNREGDGQLIGSFGEPVELTTIARLPRLQCHQMVH